jgi:16S rRNA (guanine966-N2)-methyltransferase
VKEAMFSMIQNYIYEAEVLDLFSGSGALALESISRGAKKAIICDKSKKAIQIIKKNIQKTHFDNEIQIVNKDYKKALEELKNKKFDIIFLDPPYKTDFGKEAIKIILKNEMLEEDGIMIFETDKEDTYIESTKELAKVIGIRKYGRVKLILLCRKESM